MRLSAALGDEPPNPHVLAFTINAAKSIAAQFSGLDGGAGNDHAAVEFARLRARLQEGLGFRGEKKLLARLVNVHSAESEAIVEQYDLVGPPIEQRTAESTVQLSKKIILVLLVEMNQGAGIILRE